MERMNFFRRIAALTVGAAMVLSLAGCVRKPAEPTEPTVPTEPVTAETAIARLQEQSEALGFDNALDELSEKNTTQIGGDTYIRLQQYYEGIPVYGRTLVYASDENGALTSLTGNVQDVDEDLDLTPTVAADAVIPVVNQFFADTFGAEADITVDTIDLKEEDLCILAEGTDQKSHLAYAVVLNGYELVIDAHDGTLLQSDCQLRWASTQDLEGQKSSYEDISILTENGEHRLTDTERKITTLKANHTEKSEYWGFVKYNVYIHNDADEVVWRDGGKPPADAVDAYVNTQIAYNYFDQVLGNTGPDGEGRGKIRLVTGVQYILDEDGKASARRMNNASTSVNQDENDILLTFGVGTDGKLSKSAYIDWVAHEYTHAVEQYHSTMIYKGESGAIMEGLSDIFGELAESWGTGKEPNWVFTETTRNMRDPRSEGHPAAVGEKDQSRQDYVHGYSTIISHSAYLMWNGMDGDASKKLSEKELAELWYRAMLMMPSDCDYILCRKLVETASLSMEELSDEQRACVREAFDQVGIATAREDAFHADYKVAEDCTLTVYDRNNELYSGFSLGINGVIDTREIASNMTPDVGWIINRTATVEEPGPYTLDLPMGYYALTITDPHHDEAYTIYVEISDEHTETNIDLITAYEEPIVVVMPTDTLDMKVTYRNDQLPSVTTYDYDARGLLQSETLWQGESYRNGYYEYVGSTIAYQYDENGRLIRKIEDGLNEIIVEYGYQEDGLLSYEHNLFSDLYVRYAYDPDGNCTGVYRMDRDGNPTSGEEYTFDSAGNKLTYSDIWYSGGEEMYSETTTYEYDPDGHLLSARSAYSETLYTYDSHWNLICREVTGEEVSIIERSTYDEQNRLIQKEVEEFGYTTTETYTYDSHGNILTSRRGDEETVYHYTALPESASTEDSIWKQAYKEFVIYDREIGPAADNDPFAAQYYLADMNADGIPELFINYGSHAAGAVVCTTDGKVVTSIITYSSSFVPEEGLLLSTSSFQGMNEDMILEIRFGDIERIASGSWIDEEVAVRNGDEPEYIWNDLSITREAYERNLSSAFNTERSIPIGYIVLQDDGAIKVGPNVLSYEQILSVLS